MPEPHESSHFAFQELVQLARIDRRIRGAERRVLDRFARHLGIPATKAERYYRVCRKRTLDFPVDPQRQLDLLRMLARVALSDGEIQEEERRFFERLADDFQIPRTRLAHVLESAEADAHRHARLDRRWLCAGFAGMALVAATWLLWANSRPDEMTGFKALDGALRPTLLLVHTRYTLRRSGRPDRRLAATGTGFFVRSDGLAVTNKHVVKPWRFQGKALDLIAEGYELAPEATLTLAWREDARAFDFDRRPIVESSFNTRDGTLELVGFAPDAELPLARRPVHLRQDGLFCHANDNGDLAVLRCKVPAPVAPAELASTSASVRRLDPVMVLGYPRGLHLLETERATSSPTVGRVRKIEDTIQITAPVVGGNSGGPVLDREGRVIGIATRTFGSATLAGCLRIEHVHELLRRTR